MSNKEKVIEQVFDETNSENEPWLLNSHLDECYKDPKDNVSLLSAEYIWSLKGSEREELVKRTFGFLRTKSFKDILLKLSDEELKHKYKKLIEHDSKTVLSIDNEIINSNSICTDVLKHFCGELFYAASGDGKKSYSCKEIFEDDEKLLKVLRNRMGFRTSKEDGKIRPYVFSMSDKMVFQGMRSSGLAYSVSTFKPLLAKYIIEDCYEDLNKTEVCNNVFDYSCGWGARALGAGSIKNKKYFGIDPLTHQHVNYMMKYYEIEGFAYPGGSENKETYNGLIQSGYQNKFDIAFSSPPYYTLETYDTNQSEQSVNQYPDYNDWLQQYWENTVKNCINYVLDKTNRRFVLVSLERYKKYNLANDMVNICLKNNLQLVKQYSIKTSKSHLSNKVNTKQIDKNTEKIFVFK